MSFHDENGEEAENQQILTYTQNEQEDWHFQCQNQSAFCGIVLQNIAQAQEYKTPGQDDSNNPQKRIETGTSDELEDNGLVQIIEQVYSNNVKIEKHLNQLERAINEFNSIESIDSAITDNIHQYAEKAKQEILNEIAIMNRKQQQNINENMPKQDPKFAMKITEKIQDMEKILIDKSHEIDVILQKYMQTYPMCRLPHDFDLINEHKEIFQNIIYSDKTIQEFSDETCRNPLHIDGDIHFELTDQFNVSSIVNKQKRKRNRKNKNKNKDTHNQSISVTNIEQTAPIEFAKQISTQSVEFTQQQKKQKIIQQPEKKEKKQSNKKESNHQQLDGNEDIKQFEIIISGSQQFDKKQKFEPKYTDTWLKKISNLRKKQ